MAMPDLPWLLAGRRAFSLRGNLRHLVSPPAASLRPVDGLRALSVLWVMVFHVYWFLGYFIPPQSFRRVAGDPALRLIWCGDLGVDCFFTISGLLIGDLLLREHDATGTVAVGRFYVRRAMRILPAHVLALWLYCRLGLPRCETA